VVAAHLLKLNRLFANESAHELRFESNRDEFKGVMPARRMKIAVTLQRETSCFINGLLPARRVFPLKGNRLPDIDDETMPHQMMRCHLHRVDAVMLDGNASPRIFTAGQDTALRRRRNDIAAGRIKKTNTTLQHESRN
jgi:hypothetical protein